MKGKITFAMDGTAVIQIDGGADFETASAAIEALRELMGGAGIEFAEALPVEQHRHDSDGADVYNHHFSHTH